MDSEPSITAGETRAIDWPRVFVVIVAGFVTVEAAYFSWVDQSLYGVFGWIIPFTLTVVLFGRRFFREPQLTRDFCGRSWSAPRFLVQSL